MAKAQKPRPPKNADDKAQSERFIETARELGADDSGEKFERAFKKVVPPKRERSR
jgi:hypothetical protein